MEGSKDGLTVDRSDELFTSAYRDVVASATRVEDGAERYENREKTSVKERLVRCIWFDQDLKTDQLRTVDGRKVTVLSPGWWNLEAGPDFLKASLRLSGGEITTGGVELHLQARGWYQHGHHEDPRYDDVILHVVLWNDLGAEYVTASDRSQIPQLVLEPYLTSDLTDLVNTIDTEDYPVSSESSAGLCHQKIAAGCRDDEWVGKLLDYAGDERILSKMRRFEARAQNRALDQVLYEGIMEAAGYKNNKAAFVELARRVPIRTLRQLREEVFDELTPVRLQAVLFGVAGLLPMQVEMPNSPDPETYEYVAGLRDLWRTVKGGFADRVMASDEWRFDGTRPMNFPTRRIAAMSQLLAECLDSGLTKTFLDAFAQSGRGQPRRRLVELFAEHEDGYWDRRYVFGGKQLARPTRLIGKDRAATILIDVVLPVLLLHAKKTSDTELERSLHSLYVKHPRLADNDVVRFMSCRIFGSPKRGAELVTSARRQQGLHQIFRDYCEQDERGCRRCGFALAMG